MSYNNHCLVEPCEWKLHLPSAETIKWSVINQSNLAQLSGKPNRRRRRWRRRRRHRRWRIQLKRRTKTQPNCFLESKPNPKSRTLIADRTPAKEPILWKREGEALTSPGNPLTNLTTIKLSRKKVRKLQAERVWKVCFARFLQSSIYPPWPNP